MRFVKAWIDGLYKIEPTTEISHLAMSEILDCFVKKDEILLFMDTDIWIKYFSTELQMFIRDRTNIVSNKWIFSDEYDTNDDNMNWFKLRNGSELDDYVKMAGAYRFVCAVMKKNESLNNISYIIEHKEDSKLSIREKRYGDFEKNVIPRIETILGKINIEIASDDSDTC